MRDLIKEKEMNNTTGIKKIKLHGGRYDGEIIEVHEELLKMRSILGMEDDNGEVTEYGLDDNMNYILLTDENRDELHKGWFVFDDDGNVISNEKSEEDALKALDEYNNKMDKLV